MSDKKIHIMHILNTLASGGMEGGVVNLVNGIDQDKFKVSICCLETSGVLEERINSGRRKVFVLNKKRGKAWTLPYQLKDLIRSEKVNIVHTHNYGTLLYGGIASIFAKDTSLVHGEHGDLPLQLENRKYMFVRKMLGMKINKFHTVSKQLKDLLVESTGVSSEKVYHIPNGLYLDKFIPVDRGKTRIKLGLPEDDFILLAVGSFYPWKNQEFLIRTAVELQKRNISFSVLFAGCGPLRESLEGKVKDNKLTGRVRFLGFRDDVTDLINASDILIQPSLTEGMSNTIMEAMACGTPVLASDVGGNPELVQHGETGYLFPLDNMEFLMDKICELYNHREKCARMGQNARKIAEEKYSMKDMIKQYEALYQSSSGII